MGIFWRGVCCGLWALTVAGGVVAQGAEQPGQETGHSNPRPNVVVVLLDDVGVDRVAAYGTHPNPGRTPVLDALCADGAMFRRAWAMPICSPTRASLLTGRYPSRHGIGDRIAAQDEDAPQLDPAEVILPEALPGYSHRAVGKWHLRRAGEPLTHPLDCGFRGHAGSMFNLNSTGYWDWEKVTDGVASSEPRYATTVTTNDALQAIEGLPEPYFLYVAYNAAHTPYHVPPSELHTYGETQDNKDRYRAMVQAMDTELGRIVAAVDLSSTYLFVLGDNGTPKSAVTKPHDKFHAKGTLYEGGVQVPFVVLGPGVVPGERSALVGVTDVFRTLMELTGGTVEPEDSVSFAPVLTDPDHPGARDFLYAEFFKDLALGEFPDRAIRSARYKWLHNSAGAQLFDLEADPFELDNRIDDPELEGVLQRLTAALPEFP